VASVPATVTVAGGTDSAVFNVATQKRYSTSSVNISATYGGIQKTAKLTVTR
jgi:hypothetical protein